MNKIVYTIVILLATSGFLLAQHDEDLGARIQQFTTQLSKLQSLSDRYDNQKARELLLQAIKRFNDARDSWDAHRLRDARVQFLEAVNLYNRASRLLLYKPALNLQNTLDETIHHAEISLQKNDNRDARYLLNRARDFQLKASRQMNLSDYVKGQEYIRIALHFAQQSIEFSERTSGSSINQFNYEDELAHIQELYREIRRNNQNDRNIDELLRKVEVCVGKSKNLYENNNERQAFSQLQIAEKLLFRAVDLTESEPVDRTQKLEGNINSLRQFLNSIEVNINNLEDDNDKKFYNRAVALLNECEIDYNNGSLDKASTKLILAQRFANRALQFSESVDKIGSERIKNRIQEIERIIQIQKQKNEHNDNMVIGNLHNEAQKLLRKAGEEIDNNNETNAFQLVQLALRLVSRVDLLFQNEKSQIRVSTGLDSVIRNLETKLTALHNNHNLNDSIHSRINLLLDILERVKNQYQAGDLDTAGELVQIIQAQLNLILEQVRD